MSSTWSYFVKATDDGTVLSIARVDGPVMESLRHDGVWVDNPRLITALHEPDGLEAATEAEARAAAKTLEIAWS